jgi:hypothetical protein
MRRIANSEPCSKLTGEMDGHGRPAAADGRPMGTKESQPHLALLFRLVAEELQLSISDSSDVPSHCTPVHGGAS